MIRRKVGATEGFSRSTHVQYARLLHAWIVRAGLVMITAVAGASSANAATIAIGALSYDEFIPGATHAFNINNFTEAFALPSDFPVVTALTFSGASLHLVQEGGPALDVALGDITPGPLLESGNPLFSLQFASTASFLSARLTATLNVASWLLEDGTIFTPSTLTLVADLFAANGQALAPGDFTTIGAESAPVSTVPEPATGTLLLVAGAAAIVRRRLMR